MVIRRGGQIKQNSMLQVVQVVSHVLLNWFKQVKKPMKTDVPIARFNLSPLYASIFYNSFVSLLSPVVRFILAEIVGQGQNCKASEIFL